MLGVIFNFMYNLFKIVCVLTVVGFCGFIGMCLIPVAIAFGGGIAGIMLFVMICMLGIFGIVTIFR